MSEAVCRICMIKQEDMIDLFQYNMGNDVATAFLMRLCDIQIVQGDGLSSKICAKCLRCLKSAYKFKTQCEQTDIILRQKAKTQNIDPNEKIELNRPENTCDAYYTSYAQEHSLISPQASEAVESKKNNILVNAVMPTIIKEPNTKKIKARKNATCPVCYQKFENYEDYQLHVQKHNEDIEKPYKCKVCGKSYLCASRLNRHLFTHTDIKLYECSVCRKGFNNSAHMKSHMYVHTGEKPFSCNVCDKGFNQMPHLKRHMQTYHKD